MNPREAWELLEELAAARTAGWDVGFFHWQWWLVSAPLRVLDAAGVPVPPELMDQEPPLQDGNPLQHLEARMARWEVLAPGVRLAEVALEGLGIRRGRLLLAEASRGVFHPSASLKGWWSPQQAVWAEGYWVAWQWRAAPQEEVGFEAIALLEAGRVRGLRVPRCLEEAAGEALVRTRAGVALGPRRAA